MAWSLAVEEHGSAEYYCGPCHQYWSSWQGGDLVGRVSFYLHRLADEVLEAWGFTSDGNQVSGFVVLFFSRTVS